MSFRAYLSAITLAFTLDTQGHAQVPPSQAELQYLSSVLPLIQNARFDEAQTKLEDGLTQFPRSAILSNALGMVLEQEHMPTAAVAAYQHALEWIPKFTAAQIHLGTLYGRQGNCAQAKTLLSAAADTTNESGALSAIGLSLADCQDFAAAAKTLSKAHELDPGSESLRFNLALAQFKSGDASSACRNNPTDTYCTAAAVALIREERFLEASELLARALSNVPPSAAMLSTAGLAQFSLGRYNDAVSSYSKAIELDPKFDAAREGLGFLFYMTGSLDRAKAAVEQQQSTGERDFYLSYLHALILYRMGRDSWPQSLESVATAIQQNAAFAPAYFLRGKIQMEQSNLDGALLNFQTAARLDKTYALPYYKMEQIYLRQNRSAEARAAQQQFLALGAMREDEVLTRQARNRLLSEAR